MRPPVLGFSTHPSSSSSGERGGVCSTLFVRCRAGERVELRRRCSFSSLSLSSWRLLFRLDL